MQVWFFFFSPRRLWTQWISVSHLGTLRSSVRAAATGYCKEVAMEPTGKEQCFFFSTLLLPKDPEEFALNISEAYFKNERLQLPSSLFLSPTKVKIEQDTMK